MNCPTRNSLSGKCLIARALRMCAWGSRVGREGRKSASRRCQRSSLSAAAVCSNPRHGRWSGSGWRRGRKNYGAGRIPTAVIDHSLNECRNKAPRYHGFLRQIAARSPELSQRLYNPLDRPAESDNEQTLDSSVCFHSGSVKWNNPHSAAHVSVMRQRGRG